MIFDELKPNENDLFKNFSSKDLIYIITLINDFYLYLRNKLNISATFGLEIEFNGNYSKELTIQKLDSEFFKHGFEGYSSIIDSEKVEVNSGILKDNKKTWLTLKEVLEIIKSYGSIASNCSGHINIGTQILGSNTKSWLNFILIWACYEDIIFRFTSGEWKSIRTRTNHYAKAISYKYLQLFNKIQNNPNILNNYDVLDIIFDINALFTKDFKIGRYNAVN